MTLGANLQYSRAASLAVKKNCSMSSKISSTSLSIELTSTVNT